MTYVVPVSPGIGVIAPPDVVRNPHWCVFPQPPASMTVAVPPVPFVQTVRLPSEEIVTLSSGGPPPTTRVRTTAVGV